MIHFIQVSMEDIPLGVDMVLVAYLAEMELNRGPEHAQNQEPNMVVSPVRSKVLDLLQRPRIATLDHAVRNHIFNQISSLRCYYPLPLNSLK